METSDSELSESFKGPGALESGLTGIKNTLVNCLFLLNKAEYTGVLIVSTEKNRKD
jgi:hypothetical protein